MFALFLLHFFVTASVWTVNIYYIYSYSFFIAFYFVLFTGFTSELFLHVVVYMIIVCMAQIMNFASFQLQMDLFSVRFIVQRTFEAVSILQTLKHYTTAHNYMHTPQAICLLHQKSSCTWKHFYSSHMHV